MKAGRELDAMVAEKVMGWIWVKDNHGVHIEPGSVDDCDCKSHAGGNECLPYYSTNIAPAWEVVEKLAASEDWDEHPFEIHKNYNFKPTWTASFDDYTHEGWSEVSAAHAICLAALKAVESGTEAGLRAKGHDQEREVAGA